MPEISDEVKQDKVLARLASYALVGKSSKEITSNPDFQVALPELKMLYTQAWRWHGTGRYQYTKNADGRVYLGDVLHTIIDSKGLVPHRDPLDYTQGVMHSISTSPSRVYASLYAIPHFEEGKQLRNRFHTRAGWFYYGMTAVFEALKHDRRLLSKKFQSEVGLNKEGVAYFYAKYTQRDPKDFDFTGGGISDIKGNYPMVIGIKEGAFEEVEIAKVLRKHESRSKTPIGIDDFTHIEVPEENVREVKAILSRHGYESLPVIPLEWGEEFSKTLPVSFLRDGVPFGHK